MLLVLGMILLLSIVIVGGDRGVMSLLALCGNLFVISLAIWLMASGMPVLLTTIGAGIAISCITLFYQNGVNVKTCSAFIAVLVTMCILFLVIYTVVWKSEAGGLNEIQMVGEDVFYYNMNLDINMQNVAVSVIILSTLGTVLDTALTVTTSVYEVKLHRADLKMEELMESGVQIGREVIGTTVNTLLFAYLGESLLLFAYLKIQNYSIELLLNSKILFQNCVSMIFGAISCGGGYINGKIDVRLRTEIKQWHLIKTLSRQTFAEQGIIKIHTLLFFLEKSLTNCDKIRIKTEL